MRDLPDKMHLAMTLLKRGRGVRGKISAVRYLTRLAGRYIGRKIPFVGRIINRMGGWEDLRSESHSDIDQPTNVYRLELLQFKLSKIPVKVDPSRPYTLNFFLPTIDPLVIFGGYIAALNLVKCLLDEGHRVRLISCEPTLTSKSALDAAMDKNRLLGEVLPRCEVYLRNDRSKPIPFGPEDEFLSYSWETTRHAHSASQQVNGKRVVFLIQEFEPIFHPLDSVHFLAAETYSLPHFALFNSSLLRDFFRDQKLGVFAPDSPDPEGLHAFFSHAITEISPPPRAELAARTTRKLLYYARPESHAGRNLFEIGVMALNQAIEQGVFDERWEFTGIGSMSLSGHLALKHGRKLEMAKRMPLDEYQRFVSGHDVGLCLMYAPHPSVPPFEMASAGLPTVTTSFSNRPVEVMRAITPNLLAAEPTIRSLVRSLEEAAARADDVDARLAGAHFEKVCSWSQSFSPELIARLPFRSPKASPSVSVPSRPLAART